MKPKPMQARTSPVIVRQYRAIQRMMKKKNTSQHQYVYGAQQALAWVLRDNAMLPSKAFGGK